MVSEAELISKGNHSLVPGLDLNFCTDGMGPFNKSAYILFSVDYQIVLVLTVKINKNQNMNMFLQTFILFSALIVYFYISISKKMWLILYRYKYI